MVLSLINESLFTSSESGLSIVQQYYNDLYEIVDGNGERAFVPSKRIDKVPLWFISIILVFLSILYGIFAAREEIADAFEELKMKIVDQSIVTVNDPFLERLAATMSSLGIVSNKKEAKFGPVSSSGSGFHPDDKDGDGQKDKRVFGSSFMSYLTLDLATDFLGSIVKRIMR